MNDTNDIGYAPDALADCKKRAHAFIARSESAAEVTLPGWLARKISAYIMALEVCTEETLEDYDADEEGRLSKETADYIKKINDYGI